MKNPRPGPQRLVLLALGATSCQPVTLSGSLQGGVDVSVAVVVNQYNPNLVTLTWDPETCPDATGHLALLPRDGQVIDSLDDPYELTVLGLEPETEYQFTLSLDDAIGTCGTAAGLFTTGSVPHQAPNVDQTADDGTTTGWIMTAFASEPCAAALLNTAGEVLWYWPEPKAQGVSRAILARDRRSVYYTAYSLNPETPDDMVNELVKVSLDGDTVTRVQTRELHHDLLERADGTIAYLGSTSTQPEPLGDVWTADILVELMPDGSDRVLWNAWDLIPWAMDNLPEDPLIVGAREWTHANALQYSEAQDAYFVSLRYRNSIVKIDAGTGEVLSVFGGDLSTWALDQGQPTFGQHQFRVDDERLLVFDNGSPESLDSRAVEFEVDWSAERASQTWEYYADPEIYSFVLGDVEWFDNGNRMIVWATAGQIDVVTPESDIAWRLNTPLGSPLGYIQWIDDLGPVEPDCPPAAGEVDSAGMFEDECTEPGSP